MNPFDLGSPIPWMLFALIFFWTPPHFWALALYRSGEYAKANVPMMNEVKGAKRTVTESKFYCGGLLLLGSVPCFWPESGLPLLWAFVAGGLTIWYAQSVWQIDVNEPLDENGRMPKAASRFSDLLHILAPCSFRSFDFVHPTNMVGIPWSLTWWRGEEIRTPEGLNPLD